MNLQNTPPCGFNRFPLDKLTDRLNRLSVFVSGEKLFNKKALIVLFILVLSCLGQFLASKINNLQQ